jgi:hypothetical protein
MAEKMKAQVFYQGEKMEKIGRASCRERVSLEV